MQWVPSEQTQMLKDSARQMLRREWSIPIHWDRDEVAAAEGQLWRISAELGWPRLLLPEILGGMGAGIEDVAGLAEEIGFALAPLPLGTIGFPVIHVLWKAGLLDALEAVLTGDVRVGTNLPDATVARIVGDSVTFPYVAGMGSASHLLLVSDRHDGIGGFGPVSTLTRSVGTGTDALGFRSGGVVCTTDELTSSAFSIRLGPDDLASAVSIGSVANSAEMVGSMKRLVEMSVAYAKDRIQFGRPIGSYQAIQHRCAEMVILEDISQLMVVESCTDFGLSRHRSIDSNCESVSGMYRQLIRHAQQIHAGAGFISEHELPKRFRHMQMRTCEYTNNIVEGRVSVIEIQDRLHSLSMH